VRTAEKDAIDEDEILLPHVFQKIGAHQLEADQQAVTKLKRRMLGLMRIF
jgi:hypothetical protein